MSRMCPPYSCHRVSESHPESQTRRVPDGAILPGWAARC
jgi:hypothetical protein